MISGTTLIQQRKEGHFGRGRIIAIALAVAFLTGGIAAPAFASPAPVLTQEAISDTDHDQSTPDRIRPPSRIIYKFVILT